MRAVFVLSALILGAVAEGRLAAGGLPRTKVFWIGLAGSRCYRIPTILRSSSGTLLAFAEQRFETCSDSGHANLVLRRSADDGETWEPRDGVITLARWSGAELERLSNVNPVEVALRSDGAAGGPGGAGILVHYDTRTNPSPAVRGRNVQVWSFDDGLTWTDRADVTATFAPADYTGCMPGPSVGLVVEGVVYFTCHMLRGALLYWSRDRGGSWEASPPVPGLNECSIADLPGRRILMNCRTAPGAGRGRRQLVWNVSGVGDDEAAAPKVLADFSPKGLMDPVCQGSIIRLGSALYLSNDNSAAARAHLTVRRSVDDGRTWDAGLLVSPSGVHAGYSQLVGWVAEGGRETLGLLFEEADYLAWTRWLPREGVLRVGADAAAAGEDEGHVAPTATRRGEDEGHVAPTATNHGHMAPTATSHAEPATNHGPAAEVADFEGDDVESDLLV